jgi:hypothetical protein
VSKRYKVAITVEAESVDDAVDQAADIMVFALGPADFEKQGGVVEEVAE